MGSGVHYSTKIPSTIIKSSLRIQKMKKLTNNNHVHTRPSKINSGIYNIACVDIITRKCTEAIFLF